MKVKKILKNGVVVTSGFSQEKKEGDIKPAPYPGILGMEIAVADAIKKAEREIREADIRYSGRIPLQQQIRQTLAEIDAAERREIEAQKREAERLAREAKRRAEEKFASDLRIARLYSEYEREERPRNKFSVNWHHFGVARRLEITEGTWHNGFGERYQHTLSVRDYTRGIKWSACASAPRWGDIASDDAAYRRVYDDIIELWRRLDAMLDARTQPDGDSPEKLADAFARLLINHSRYSNPIDCEVSFSQSTRELPGSRELLGQSTLDKIRAQRLTDAVDE